MAVWRNADGLDVKFGTEQASSLMDAGVIKTFDAGALTVVEVELDLTLLTTSEQILSDVVWIPGGAQIAWVESTCEEVGATGTSIDVGLVEEDRTEEDYDGLLAEFPLTGNYDAVGDTVRFYANATVPASMTGTGALIGTILSDTHERYYLSASYHTGSAFTTGRLRLRVAYLPNALGNN